VGDKQALLLMPHKVSPNLVGGFFENSIRADVRGGTIGGGGRATTTDIGAGGAPNHVEGYFGTVSGGEDNIAGNRNEEPQYQRGATVGGGINNRARDEGATVAGGSTNKATASRSTVGGGGINDADGAAATVGGGFFNRATGEKSTIAGGFSNTASGTYSAIPGGHLNTAGGDHSLAAGSEANATQAGSFVWGDDSGKGNSLSSYGANTVSFGATGGARFVTAYSGGNPSAGVKLASGGGSWSSLSDRAAKRNLRPVDRRALLSKLAAVPVYSWGYKTQSPSIRHLGPMAQGFRSAFGLGEDNKHIDTIDSEGIALAAIQGLYRQNQALAHRNRELNSRLDRQKHMLTHKNKALNARLDRQHQALTRLERKVAPLLAKQH